MRKIKDQKQYTALLQTFFANDIHKKNSLMKTILINKMINHLFLKMPDTERDKMIEMLKSGISEEFVNYMFDNLTNEDFETIARSAGVEFSETFNLALIKTTDGN